MRRILVVDDDLHTRLANRHMPSSPTRRRKSPAPPVKPEKPDSPFMIATEEMIWTETTLSASGG